MALGHPEALYRLALEVELNEHHGLVADDPAIMARFDRDDLRRLALHATAVRILDMDASTRKEPDVRMHAQIGADDWFHVDRPPESCGIDHPLDTGCARGR